MTRNHLLQVLALLMCCLGVACSATPGGSRSLIIDSEAAACRTSTIDLYRAAGYSETTHRGMSILDADENNILFAMESKRKDAPNALGEGILAQTVSVGLFSQQSGEVTQVAMPSAPSPSYLYQGVVAGNELWLIFIALDGDDNQYSVVHVVDKVASPVCVGVTDRDFLQWPQLIKLGDGVLLMEMGTDTQPATFSKLTQEGLHKVNLAFPKDAELVSNQYASDGNRMVTLWGRGEQSLLIINDLDKLVETIALPPEDGIIDFALMQDALAVSVKSRTTEKSYLRYTSLKGNKTDYYPCIETYRMNGRLQKGQFVGLSSNFAPYLFRFDANGAVQSAIDISEWCENGQTGRATVFTTSKNTYLLNLHDEQQIVRIEVD